MDAWVPTLQMIDINEIQAVLKIIDWSGGFKDKPPINTYIGITGIVNDIKDAKKLKSVTKIIQDILNEKNPLLSYRP